MKRQIIRIKPDILLETIKRIQSNNAVPKNATVIHTFVDDEKYQICLIVESPELPDIAEGDVYPDCLPQFTIER